MKRVAVGLLIVVAVFAVVFVAVERRRSTPISGLAPAVTPPFDDGGGVVGATRAMYRADGGALAVLSGAGLGIAEEGAIRPITAAGSHVVDAAWFPTASALLVAEGPTPTGLLAVIEDDGTVRGSIALSPAVGFGSGYGIAVAPSGKQAVVTGVERPALSEEQRFLVVVDLETGATERLTAAGGPDESGPFYVDERSVVFTETSSGKPPVARVIRLDTGLAEPIRSGASILGTITTPDGSEPVLLVGNALTTANGAELGTIPGGATAVAVAPTGAEAAAVETVVERDGGTVARLRRVPLRRKS